MIHKLKSFVIWCYKCFGTTKHDYDSVVKKIDVVCEQQQVLNSIIKELLEKSLTGAKQVLISEDIKRDMSKLNTDDSLKIITKYQNFFTAVNCVYTLIPKANIAVNSLERSMLLKAYEELAYAIQELKNEKLYPITAVDSKESLKK